MPESTADVLLDLDVTIDLGNASDEFPLVEPGPYQLRIVKITPKKKAEEGAHPYLNVEMIVLDAPAVRVWHVVSLSPKALAMNADFFAGVGVPAEQLKGKLRITNTTLQDWVGNVLTAMLYVDTYRGRKSMKVNTWIPMGTPTTGATPVGRTME